ncbi:MAG: hypothetical protein AAF489_06685 [Bacteroidota bacterium]
MKIFLNRISFLSVPLILSVLTLFGCKEGGEFQKLNLDWSNDYISELAKGFIPGSNHTNWACLRAGLPDTETVTILYQSNEYLHSGKFEALKKGFFVQGHVINTFYYIVIIDNDIPTYITESSDLLDFLDDIDTMEEALIIAKINGFLIDYNNEKGGSFREVKNGFEFLLMKELKGGAERKQYLVRVDENGKIESEEREVYCHGFNECQTNTKSLPR